MAVLFKAQIADVLR